MNLTDKFVALKNTTATFLAHKKGVAAVEFALIVPLLLALYLGSVEISTGVSVNKRLARAANTVADLVTQQDVTTKAELDAILDVGAAIMFPYTADQPIITIVGIDVDDDHTLGGKTVWSRRYNKGTYDNGNFSASAPVDIDVPDRLEIDETFLVKVTAEIEYRPIVTWVIGQKSDSGGNSYTAMDMAEEYWLRPRLTDAVDCSNC